MGIDVVNKKVSVRWCYTYFLGWYELLYHMSEVRTEYFNSCNFYDAKSLSVDFYYDSFFFVFPAELRIRNHLKCVMRRPLYRERKYLSGIKRSVMVISS